MIFSAAGQRLFLEQAFHGKKPTAKPLISTVFATSYFGINNFARSDPGPCDDLYQVVDQRYLSDQAFIETIEQREPECEERQVVEIKWAEIGERVCQHFGLPASAVLHRGRARGIVRVRRVMAWLARELGGLTNQAMAKELRQEQRC